jgi:hypothetical protein
VKTLQIPFRLIEIFPVNLPLLTHTVEKERSNCIGWRCIIHF